MSDLISRTDLLIGLGERAKKHLDDECTELTIYEDMHLVKSLPAVDATEVIRCKDCFWWMKAKVNRQGDLLCPKSGMVIMATDYCSKAEKRRCKYEK